jgi:hypothetical protein
MTSTNVGAGGRMLGSWRAQRAINQLYAASVSKSGGGLYAAAENT